jgi:hypothetical protein
MSSGECGEEFESFSKGVEGLKTCGGRISSICGGIKLWVVVVDTTFNGVIVTKLDEVTKLLAGELEIVLAPVELLSDSDGKLMLLP